MKKNKQNISENKQTETEKEPRLNFSEKTRRRFRFGTNSILLMIAVITAFVLLNLALERLPLTLDLTTEQRYSITDTTKKRLSALGVVGGNGSVQENAAVAVVTNGSYPFRVVGGGYISAAGNRNRAVAPKDRAVFLSGGLHGAAGDAHTVPS